MILFVSDIKVGFALDLNSCAGLLLLPLRKTNRHVEAAKLQKSVLLDVPSFLPLFSSILNIICNIKVQMNGTKEMYFQNKIFYHLIKTNW